MLAVPRFVQAEFLVEFSSLGIFQERKDLNAPTQTELARLPVDQSEGIMFVSFIMLHKSDGNCLEVGRAASLRFDKWIDLFGPVKFVDLRLGPGYIPDQDCTVLQA